MTILCMLSSSQEFVLMRLLITLNEGPEGPAHFTRKNFITGYQEIFLKQMKKFLLSGMTGGVQAKVMV